VKITTLLATSAAVLAITPAVASAALPTGNLVANAGFEKGPGSTASGDARPIPDWTAVQTSNPARVLRYGVDAFQAADAPAGACRALRGPITPLEGDDTQAGSTAYSVVQSIPVTAEATGRALKIGALLGRYSGSPDYGSLDLYFVNAAGTLTYASGVNDYSASVPATAEVTQKTGTTPAIPAGTTSIQIYASSVAVGFGVGRGTDHGLVDNVAVTFDATLPTVTQAPGCQPAVPTTGDASALTTETATLAGTVDTKHEDVRYFFRYGANGVLDSSTGEADLDAADGATPVSQSLTNLSASTTYSYALVTRTEIDGTAGAEVVGPVKTFTTPGPPAPPAADPGAGGSAGQGTTTGTFQGKIYKGNTFASAVTITGPKGGCVKKGSTFQVSVADKAEGVRTLRRFVVQSTDTIHNAKTTNGPVGKSSGTVKVKKVYVTAPKHTKGAKMTLTVFADFNGVQDPRGAAFGTLAGSPDSVSGQKQFKFCAVKKKK
jgi:hypothetical protein